MGGGGTPLVEQAKTTATQGAQQAQQKAGDLMEQARDQFNTQISTQKEAAVQSVGSLASALRQTGQQLRDQDQAAVSQLVDRAAEIADGVSGYLKERSPNELMGEVENFARREPVLFLGGAFALGFLAARFLKSSSNGDGAGSRSIMRYEGYGYGQSRQSFRSVMGAQRPLATDPGGPIETAGGSVWTGDGPSDDPRGQRIYTGGERDASQTTGGYTGGMTDTDDGDDAYELTSTSQGRG